MEDEGLKIGVIGKDRFANRLSLDEELGDFLHDQLVGVLELICEKGVERGGPADIRIGVFLDSNNDGARYFIIKEAAYDLISDFFGHALNREIKKFAKKEQSKGASLLFQLNSGDLTIKDFKDNI